MKTKTVQKKSPKLSKMEQIYNTFLKFYNNDIKTGYAVRKKYRKERVPGLNRRVFYSNLKRVLKDYWARDLKYTFEDWVEDYKNSYYTTGTSGWFEVNSSFHKKNYSQEIRTN